MRERPDAERQGLRVGVRPPSGAVHGGSRLPQDVERAVGGGTGSGCIQCGGVGEHRGIKARLLAREREVGLAHPLQRAERVGPAGIEGRVELQREQVEPASRKLADQVIAVGEMPIRRGGGHPDAARRLRQRDAGHAPVRR